MSNSKGNSGVTKAERICNRLQVLLDQWTDSIPAISIASGKTLISQFNYFVSTINDDTRKEKWAQHDMPYLLMQTLSQLWDLEENVDILVSNGIINAVRDMYHSLSCVLLSQHNDIENRFPEFLALLSTICEAPSDMSSPNQWTSTLNSLQETFLPLLLNSLTHYPDTRVEIKRQLCFTIISLFSGNPKTVIKVFSVHRDDLTTLVQQSLLSGDFPTQCTTFEIIFRVYLMARSLENTAILIVITTHYPLEISSIHQSQFIQGAREMLNSYNNQHDTQVKSLAIADLLIVTTKTETSLGTVHWLDIGKETISCYLEVKSADQEAAELQLLSIRWSTIQSIDLIDRAFSIRIHFTPSPNTDTDILLPYLNTGDILCIRAAFADPASFTELRTLLQERSASLPCQLQQVTATANGVTTMVSAPRGRGEPSLSQTAGCKSSVVVMKTVSKEPEKHVNASIFQPIQDENSVTEPPEMKQQNEDIDEKIKSLHDSPVLQAGTTVAMESQKSSIALPIPEVTEIPATPDQDKLFPSSQSTPKAKVALDALGSLHNTPSRPSKEMQELNVAEEKSDDKANENDDSSSGKKTPPRPIQQQKKMKDEIHEEMEEKDSPSTTKQEKMVDESIPSTQQSTKRTAPIILRAEHKKAQTKTLFAGLSRRGGLAFLSHLASKPVAASSLKEQTDDDSEEEIVMKKATKTSKRDSKKAGKVLAKPKNDLPKKSSATDEKQEDKRGKQQIQLSEKEEKKGTEEKKLVKQKQSTQPTSKETVKKPSAQSIMSSQQTKNRKRSAPPQTAGRKKTKVIPPSSPVLKPQPDKNTASKLEAESNELSKLPVLNDITEINKSNDIPQVKNPHQNQTSTELTQTTLPLQHEQSAQPSEPFEATDDSSDVDDEATHIMNHFKTILSTPKIRLAGNSAESSPSSALSESDSDDPGILAVQQALTTLLIQQKKEKKRLIQQNRRQLEGSIRSGAQKILKASESQLQSIITKKEQAVHKLKHQLDIEMKTVETKREEYEKEMNDRLLKLQTLREQMEELNKSINYEVTAAAVMEQCSIEMKKMQEKVSTEYSRKMKIIKRKNGMKKRNEIQKLMQLTLNSIAGYE